MDIISKSDEGNGSVGAAGTEKTTLSLEELIADIDRETGKISAHEYSKGDISQDLVSKRTHIHNQYIMFAVEKTLFALPLSSAVEIGHRPNITLLPNLPHWVFGISNIRGEIVSFISLKAFLGIPSSGTKLERRFLVIHNPDIKVGIVVDKILGIHTLDQIEKDIQKSPYREGEIAAYILGVAVSGENLLNILDIDRLLSSSKMTDFRTV